MSLFTKPVQQGIVAGQCGLGIHQWLVPARQLEHRLRNRLFALHVQQHAPHQPGVPVQDQADPGHLETGRGRVGVGPAALLEHQCVQGGQQFPGRAHAGRDPVTRDVVLLEVPEVHIGLDAVLVQDPVALDGFQIGSGGSRDDGLDQRLLRVERDVDTLVQAVHHVGHRDGPAVVERRLEVAAVVVLDAADRGGALRHGDPGLPTGIPVHGVGRNLQGVVRTRGFNLEVQPERLRLAGERVVPHGRILQLPPDVRRVDVADAADRVPGGTLGPHPEVAHRQFIAAFPVGGAQRPQAARAGRDVLRDAGDVRLDGIAVQDRGDPDADAFLQPQFGHPLVEFVAGLPVREVALEQPAAQGVQFLVLVLPEAYLAPARHVALPRGVVGVDAAVVVALGRAPPPALRIQVPSEVRRVGGVDRLDGRGKGLVGRGNPEAGAGQRRLNQIAHVPALVLHADDELQDNRLVLEMPDPILENRPCLDHGRRDLRPCRFRIMVQSGLVDLAENGQVVEVRGADVCQHRHGLALVDLAGHKLPVDQALHRPPHLRNGERVQGTLGGRCRIENQRNRGGRRLEQLDLFLLELPGRTDLQVVVVEVHLAGLQVQRGAIHVEGPKAQGLHSRTGQVVRRRVGFVHSVVVPGGLGGIGGQCRYGPQQQTDGQQEHEADAGFSRPTVRQAHGRHVLGLKRLDG